MDFISNIAAHKALKEVKFSVQDFMIVLSQEKELSQILQNLNTWKNENASQMSTVLKEQTDAVISIAEDVQALLKKIETVSGPIYQLLEEITAISKRIIEFASIYADKLNVDTKVRMADLHMACVKIYNRMLKRAKYLMRRIGHIGDDAAFSLQRVLNMYICYSGFITDLDSMLLGGPPIEDMMSDFITKMFLKSYKTKNLKLITCTVLSAQQLKEEDCIKKIICNHIVKPVLEPFVNDNYLQTKSLKSLYGDMLNLLKDEFKIFLMEDIFQFDFIYECFWPVANELMRENLLSITDAGHPDDFFNNFSETSRFIQTLIDTYGSKSNYSYEVFKDHLTRFSLYVYYEIRHQHCAYVFEMSIMQLTKKIDKDKSLYFEEGKVISKLNTTVSMALDAQLEFMFHKDVFLMPLSDQFVKLSVILIVRYNNWILSTFLNKETAIKLDDKYGYLLIICDLAYFMRNRVGSQEKSNTDFTTSIYAIAADSFREILSQVMFHNYMALESTYLGLTKKFIEEITTEVITLLKNMFSIPRLYRRTNRSVPTEHSSYIDSAVEVLLKIHKYYDGSNDLVSAVCTDIIEKSIMSACSSMKSVISELISSINKTESSLRRLKNRFGASSSGDDSAANTNSDEYKIRMQVTLDVKQFVSKVKPSLHKDDQLRVIDELMLMVNG